MSETEEQIGVLGRLAGFVGRNRVGVITGVIAVSLAGLLFYALINTSVQPKEKEAPPPIQVQIQRPKPPPPPPPPPKIPQEKLITPQKTVTPTPAKPIPHPAPPKAAPPKAGPPPLGTSIHNNSGDSGFGALANGGGDGMVGGTGGGGGGSYEGAVAADIEAALSRNPVTRNANAGLQVRIWLNADGTVTRVELDKSSGDPAVDNAVKNQVLAGMQLPAPPAGTAMPISMSLTGQAPL